MVAGGVDPIRKEDHGFASLNAAEIFLHELVHRIIEMCAKASAGAFNTLADFLTIAGRLGLNFYSHAEGYDPNLIVWSQLLDEGLRRIFDLAKSRPGGSAGIKHQDNREGSLCGGKVGNLLFNAFFVNVEILHLQIRDEPAVTIKNAYWNRHQRCVNAHNIELRLASSVRRRFFRRAQ